MRKVCKHLGQLVPPSIFYTIVVLLQYTFLCYKFHKAMLQLLIQSYIFLKRKGDIYHFWCFLFVTEDRSFHLVNSSFQSDKTFLILSSQSSDNLFFDLSEMSLFCLYVQRIFLLYINSGLMLFSLIT